MMYFSKIKGYINKVGIYVFFIMSPVCFLLSLDKEITNRDYFMLLSLWFLYSFINQKARLEKIYVETENLLLVVLDMIAGFAPLIGFLLVSLIQENSITIIISLMIIIGINLLIKILLYIEKKESY